MRTLALTVALAGCTQQPVFVPQDTDETDTDASPDDTDAEDTDDTDVTEPEGTDDDGDGWTIEEGDCDDTTIWVNPAWNERPDDDLDNDCDGRIDEEFFGVLALEVRVSDGLSTLREIDLFGDVARSVPLAAPSPAGWAADAIGRDGWVLAGGGVAGLAHVSSTGVVTTLFDDSEAEYPAGAEPYAYGGVVAHPDGYYLVSGGDRLWKVAVDGSTQLVDEWDCQEGPELTTELCAHDLAVDPITGRVALVGEFGGFAWWTEAGGLDLRLRDDPEEAEHSWWAVEKRHNGAFFAMGVDADTGTTGIWRWDDDAGEFALRGEFVHPFTAADFAIDQETGDFYISASGGWYSTVFRMPADGTYSSLLYPDTVDPQEYLPPDDRDHLAILATYAEDP